LHRNTPGAQKFIVLANEFETFSLCAKTSRYVLVTKTCQRMTFKKAITDFGENYT